MNTRQTVLVNGLSKHRAASARVTHGSRVLFVREPANSNDENAIAVLDCSTNERIGFVAKHHAKMIAPYLDSGLFDISDQGARIQRIHNLYHCSVTFELEPVPGSAAYA